MDVGSSAAFGVWLPEIDTWRELDEEIELSLCKVVSCNQLEIRDSASWAC